jgi:hypothetical protein
MEQDDKFKFGELRKSEVEERTDEILILAWIGTKCRQLEQGDRSNRSVGS